MARINQTVIQSIYSLLNGNRYFTSSDFEVSFPDDGMAYVQIVFRYEPAYQFLVTEEPVGNSLAALVSVGERKQKPHTRESPGDFKSFEIKQFDEYDQAFQRIPSWCSNINADLKAKMPLFAEVEDLRRLLEERLEQHIQDPESHFSSEELDLIAQKFDELAVKFSALEEAHAITKSQLEEALSDIKNIKNNSKSFAKGMWASVTKNRMVKMLVNIASSPEGRKFALETAEHLVLGHDVTPKP